MREIALGITQKSCLRPESASMRGQRAAKIVQLVVVTLKIRCTERNSIQ